MGLMAWERKMSTSPTLHLEYYGIFTLFKDVCGALATWLLTWNKKSGTNRTIWQHTALDRWIGYSNSQRWQTVTSSSHHSNFWRSLLRHEVDGGLVVVRPDDVFRRWRHSTRSRTHSTDAYCTRKHQFTSSLWLRTLSYILHVCRSRREFDK